MRTTLIHSAVVLLLLFCSDAAAQQTNRLVIYGHLTGTQVFGDPSNGSPGGGFGLGLGWEVSDQFALITSVGYKELNGVLNSDPFSSTYVPLLLKGRLNLRPESRINTFLEFGYGISRVSLETQRFDNLPGLPENSYSGWQESMYAAMGFEFFVTRKGGITLEAFLGLPDTDYLDDFETAGPDKIAGIKLGFSFHARRGGVIRRTQEVRYVPLEEDDSSEELVELTGPEAGRTTFMPIEGGEIASTPSGRNTGGGGVSSDLGNQIIESLSDLEKDINSIQNQLNQKEFDTGSSNENANSRMPVYNSYKAEYDRGYALFHQYDYVEARNIFLSLIERDARHYLTSNSYYWLGETYFMVGQYTQALSAFEKISGRENEGKDNDALLKIGLCYVKLGRIAEARGVFQGYLDTYPPNDEYYGRVQQELMRLR